MRTARLSLTIIVLSLVITASPGRAEARACGRIFFTASDGRRQLQIRSINPDGTGTRTVKKVGPDLLVSPDGSLIAMTLYDQTSEDNDIWLMRSDGTHYRNITDTPNRDEYAYDWGPGGRRLAIERLGASGKAIYLLNVHNGKEIRVVNGYQPSFSPSGNRIAFSAPSPDLVDSTSDIFVFDLESDETHRLTEDAQSDDYYPDWSPAGDWLSFNRFPTGQMNENDGPYSDIWRVADSGEHEANLTQYQNDYGGVSVAAWSPDGAWIAYNTDSDGGGAVHVMRSDGSDRSPAFSDFLEHWSRGATWSPNGKRIVYERLGSQSTDIWTAGRDGRSKRKITQTNKWYEGDPVWTGCRS